MNTRYRRYFSGLLAFTITALAGCGGSGSSPADGTGLLSLGVSDGPVHDAQKVCITFDTVEIKGSGPSTVIQLDPAEKINLLDFQGMNASPLLVNEELPAGDYNWIRLGVDAVRGSNGGAGDTGGDLCDGAGSYIVMADGGVYNLYVPSGAQSGLKLNRGFTVPVNGQANVTAEFDLMKSITAPPGLSPDVILRPTIRLVNNVEVGSLTGQVASALATAEACQPSVYLFDDGVTPNAIDGGEVVDPLDPVATAMVNEQFAGNGAAEYHYTIGFLLPGDYEAAFTCDGTTFEPAAGVGVRIVAGEVTTQDF
jgi:Domain of unknown function (DUF4382)